MKYNLLLYILIFVVVLFMVLKDDNINQTMLVPMGALSKVVMMLL